jgi:hypothetical protein
LFAALHIDTVDTPVLVPAFVLQEENMAAVVGPLVLADAALLVVGDRLCGVEFAEGREQTFSTPFFGARKDM